MIIDSHCHLDYPVIYEDLENVIKRANENEIKYLLSICTTEESYKKIKLIVNKFKNVYGTFGIHPHETEKHQHIKSKQILDIKRSEKKIIGVGETGLDFFYNHSDKAVQKKSFVEHIQAASELNIPVIVHTRNAEQETYDILKSESKNSALKILIHCFTGSNDFAKKLIKLNSYISISGIITFSKSNELEEAVKNIPIENLLVETDSPYLAPKPFRGKSNEPSFIIHTVNKISEIKNVSNEIISDKTSDNFIKLFNLF